MRNDCFRRYIVGQCTEAVILGVLCALGMWALAAVTVGGGMMGILGMLLGVPLAAAVYRLLRQDIQKNKAEKSEVAR